MKVCKAEIYKFKNEKGKTIPDYLIMCHYDGKFLEWVNVESTGILAVDKNIGCGGSVVVHKRSHANRIIKKFNEHWAVLPITGVSDGTN